MIIGVISRDGQYKERFEQIEDIELAVWLDEVKEDYPLSVDIQALVCDGNLVTIKELPRLREKFGSIPIFYQVPKTDSSLLLKNIERICTAYQIQVLSEYLNRDQVVQEVFQKLFNREDASKKRIVSLFGTHSNAGVSTTTLNLARAISERVQDKVLVLSLNAWDSADYFLNYDGLYLNDLKVDLEMQKLTPAKLHQALCFYNGFYHLAGNRDIKAQRYYTSEEIEHLIDVAKENFDLIIIDGGTHFDNACAAQAYVSSNLRFIVTTQEDKGYRGYFPHVFNQLLEPAGGKKEDFMLIINKFEPDISLISEQDLEEELEISRITTIPSMDILGKLAIRQRKLLYDISNDLYRKPLNTVANLIISEGNLTEKPNLTNEEKSNKGLFSIFSKKRA